MRFQGAPLLDFRLGISYRQPFLASFHYMYEGFAMRKIGILALMGVMVGGLAFANNNSNQGGSTKTIKEVMAAAFKGDDSLYKKVTSGKASAEEKAKLLDCLIYLVQNEAPKGDATEWKMMSGRAMMAAGMVVVGRAEGMDELKAAGNCKACHDKFKGK